MREYPVGKAQQMVINKLGLSQPKGAQSADKVFESIGIIVSSKRVGRSSVPVITKLDNFGGSLNLSGDGEGWSNNFKSIDLTAVGEWIAN